MATAEIPTGFQPIRDTLKTKYNISDDRIGYDQGVDGNWVTIDNQKIFKDPTNIGGTTYAGQDVFGSAAGKINTLNDAYKLQQQVLNPAQTVNPADQQVNDTLTQILQKVQNPAAIDPYSSAQYVASQAASQRGAEQVTRQAQEVLGDSGFSQSTRLADRAQSIQNDANQYLQTQIVPQIIQQLQGQQQQEIGNLSTILGLLQGQQGTFDTRQQNEQNRQFDVLDYLTGRQDVERGIQREDETTAYARKYQEIRDAIFDESAKRTFDENARQFGLTYAADQAYKSGQLGMEQQRINQGERELGIREKEADARTADENKQIFDEEKRGLADALRAGEITPTQAIQQIEEDTGLGFYTKEQAAELEKVITTLTPNLPSSKVPVELTAEQEDSLPSDKEIDQIWEQQGKEQGLPRIDFRAWYKDPQGRMAGVDYATWKKVYGPQLKAR